VALPAPGRLLIAINTTANIVTLTEIYLAGQSPFCKKITTATIKKVRLTSRETAIAILARVLNLAFVVNSRAQ
jgi:hypothetical protein